MLTIDPKFTTQQCGNATSVTVTNGSGCLGTAIGDVAASSVTTAATVLTDESSNEPSDESSDVIKCRC